MRQLKCALSIVVLMAASGQQQAPQGSPHTADLFVSRRHGFSMEVPAGWHVAIGADDELPLFVNFPWSKLAAQAILPDGGASIHVIAEADLPKRHADFSLDDWARFDERLALPETIKTRDFKMPPSTGVVRALIVSYDEATFGASIQQQHDMTVYWEFRSERFATYLNFVAGDPRGEEYGRQVESRMRSIKPISGRSSGQAR